MLGLTLFFFSSHSNLSLEPPYLLHFSTLLHLSTYFSVSYLLHSSLALLIFFVFLMSVTNILVCTIVALFFYSSKLTGVGGLMVSSWLFLYLHNSVTHQLLITSTVSSLYLQELKTVSRAQNMCAKG